MRPAALVTIDVEPDDVWSDPYSRRMSNITALLRFQQLCDRHDIRPTYLVTHSVATDDTAAAVLEKVLGGNRCEVGAHSHMWETPPLVQRDSDGKAHVGSRYDPETQMAKLASLTEAIGQRFGVPRSHRAGRFGIDATQAAALAALGYEVDSSVVPGFDMSATGAPDFRRSPRMPFSIQLPGSQVLWEVPCTTRISPLARVASWLRITRRLGARVGIAPEMLRVFPNTSIGQLTSLSCAAAERFGYVNLMTHSSELTAATSPYWRSGEQVEGHWTLLDELFASWRAANMYPMTLREYVAFVRLGAAKAPAIW